jgi:hypothetical protein
MSRRTVLILLILAQAALLYLTASSAAGNGTLYGCSVLCGQSGAAEILPLVATVCGVAMFALPAVIGGLCQSRQSAVALAVTPWWLAVLARTRARCSRPTLDWATQEAASIRRSGWMCRA